VQNDEQRVQDDAKAVIPDVRGATQTCTPFFS